MDFFIKIIFVLFLLYISGADQYRAEDPHQWVNLSVGLAAHAGGGIGGYAGTNSLEAMVVNYYKGHRVFEIDLNLTTDGKLVCVHDWPSFSGPLSAEHYLKKRTAGNFTAIELRDVYAMMLTYTDMYIITDTKSFEYPDGDTFTQFRYLHDLAVEMDATLLDRVIPQIYNQRHYGILKNIYPFKSVIYTLYASPDTDNEIIKFVSDKEDIKVVTMAPERIKNSFQKNLTAAGKLIYFFTLNDIYEVLAYKNQGIHGFYTDFILPNDLTNDWSHIHGF